MRSYKCLINDSAEAAKHVPQKQLPDSGEVEKLSSQETGFAGRKLSGVFHLFLYFICWIQYSVRTDKK